jgi:uncharacterized membrane protein YhaH (DUF805 family)
MRCFIKVLRDYAIFNGRSGLREYWHFVIGWIITGLAAIWLDRVTGSYNFRTGIAVFESFWFFAIVLPWLAATVRRLHDANWSGWWALLFLTVFLWVYAAAMPSAWPVMMHTWPLAAAVALLYVIVMSQPSTKGENRFGKPEQPWC